MFILLILAASIHVYFIYNYQKILLNDLITWCVRNFFFFFFTRVILITLNIFLSFLFFNQCGKV